MVHFFAELQNNETCFEWVQGKTGAKGSGGMAKLITEADVEEMALGWFESLGYQVAHGPDIAPDGDKPERARYDDAVLLGRLRAALGRINPQAPEAALDEAARRATTPDSPSLLENNHRFHRMLTEGVDVEVHRGGGEASTVKVWLVDFDRPDANDWLVVNQLSVVQGQHRRRADIVAFVNGLPLAVFELKNPASEAATVESAHRQLRTYMEQIPALFVQNEVLVVSDGTDARAATITAAWSHFLPWKTVDGEGLAPPTAPPLEVLIRGMFDPARFLDLARHFVAFERRHEGMAKKIARYHQFHAVRKAVASTVRATGEQGNGKVGVVWHTQGSGKSLTMAFYAGKLIAQPEMRNPTLVVLTDRNDLDDQLYGTFAGCQELLRQEPRQASSREELRQLLSVPSGGVMFTTIQKFLPESVGEEYPCLSDRRNIVVIADEAHRSHYDFVDGYARNLREALPHASFIAFTGTPIELVGKNTEQVFGDTIDVYDIQQAVEDGATVPIYYEARLIPLTMDEAARPVIDEEFEEVTEGEEIEGKERLKTRWAQVAALVGADERLKRLAADLVEHFENRCAILEGKGMVVCMSRRICVDLYREIVALRPEWDSDDDEQGAVKVVMTGSASDPLDWQPHIRNKPRRERLAERFKKPDDPFRLVIVRDMWLTGFDAPCLHTMYADKPMSGHNLMQAIARVNRVFRDKPGGLVVDYLGLADNLRRALREYSAGDRESAGVDLAEAVAVLEEKLDVVRAMFARFDYSGYRSSEPAERTRLLLAAKEHVYDMDPAADRDENRKRFMEAVSELSRAFALSAPHESALAVRDEVAFFQALRASFAKDRPDRGRSPEELDAAVRQIVSKSVLSGDVVDIFEAAKLGKPDLALLSDDFLVEVRGLEQRNVAVEALRRLIDGGIKARSQRNVVEARSFAEMLEQTLVKYRNRSVEAAVVIEELIALAKEMREAAERGQKLGLTEDELAFYDALADNESAVEVMGDESLMAIARELLEQVRKNATIDWALREPTRAKLRVLVKRILRKHGYPPDLEPKAAETVLEQAERLCETWLEG